MEAKIAHLQIIQAVVTRLAGNSFMIKGWSVTLVTALLALAAASTNVLFVYLTCFPVVIFWALDAYFLRQERLFRELYNHVRGAKEDQVDFSMETQPFEEVVDKWFCVVWSPTLRLFHGSITVTITCGVIILVRICT